MVICCVPGCGTDSWKCDGSVTFYDFPYNPDLKAKWIKQINSAIRWKTAWFPRGRPVLCSKHFLHTDFKSDSDSLKPRSIPSVFGHKYIGLNPEANETNVLQEVKQSPLIVKVLRPNASVVENDSNLRISNVCSQSNVIDHFEIGTASERQIIKTEEINMQTSSHENIAVKNEQILTKSSSYTSKKTLQIVPPQVNIPNKSCSVTPIGETTQQSTSEILQHKTCISNSNSITPNNILKNPNKQQNLLLKKNIKKKETSTDLIEIGPNTFLKINPDVIKVNKKQTPAGNTVLQFVMDQKLAKNYSCDVLPKLIQNVPASSLQKDKSSDTVADIESSNKNKDILSNNEKETVQHVLGHVIDNHICEDSCVDLTLDDDDEVEPMDVSPNDVTCTKKLLDETSIDNQSKFDNSSDEHVKHASNSVLDKAPVLLTTNMPLNHCFIDRPKYILQLKQKNRQIAGLKLKISNLNKKIEELEDKCIVQERQLSYSFVKRLKTIQKNATKGDPCATYILEQIRSYSYTNNSKMRWSDSTLTQCAIWCRKAPYAYEYFKKADFFKLPCLGTVKRFIKKHPEMIKFQKSAFKSVSQGKEENDDDESSSDFDFDENDNQINSEMSDHENNESATCENILSEMANTIACKDFNIRNEVKRETNEIQKATESITNHSLETNIQISMEEETGIGKAVDVSKCIQSNGIPITVDTSNLELQEIILPSGEVVQCYSSSVVSGSESGQYFIIPNVTDQSNNADNEYNIISADSMPVILQNIENPQSPIQDQLIFVAKSSDQVECSETEITSA